MSEQSAETTTVDTSVLDATAEGEIEIAAGDNIIELEDSLAAESKDLNFQAPERETSSETCQRQVGGLACISCARSNNCPILKMLPNAKEATLDNLLKDDETPENPGLLLASNLLGQEETPVGATEEPFISSLEKADTAMVERLVETQERREAISRPPSMPLQVREAPMNLNLDLSTDSMPMSTQETSNEPLKAATRTSLQEEPQVEDLPLVPIQSVETGVSIEARTNLRPVAEGRAITVQSREDLPRMRTSGEVDVSVVAPDTEMSFTKPNRVADSLEGPHGPTRPLVASTEDRPISFPDSPKTSPQKVDAPQIDRTMSLGSKVPIPIEHRLPSVEETSPVKGIRPNKERDALSLEDGPSVPAILSREGSPEAVQLSSLTKRSVEPSLSDMQTDMMPESVITSMSLVDNTQTQEIPTSIEFRQNILMEEKLESNDERSTDDKEDIFAELPEIFELSGDDADVIELRTPTSRVKRAPQEEYVLEDQPSTTDDNGEAEASNKGYGGISAWLSGALGILALYRSVVYPAKAR